MRSVGEALYAIALTLWVGGMWVIGGVVAPTLFHVLPDRALAGMVAGRLFAYIAWIGFGCAAYIVLFRLVRFGAGALKHAAFWLTVVMLVLALAGEFGVQPILSGLKAQALPKEVMESIFRDRFSTWHGVASVLYVIECALGLLLVSVQGRNPR
jgi:hypothetical protein